MSMHVIRNAVGVLSAMLNESSRMVALSCCVGLTSSLLPKCGLAISMSRLSQTPRSRLRTRLVGSTPDNGRSA
jgi:hypothetical protein